MIFWLDGFLLQYCIAYFLQKKSNFDFYGLMDITNKPKRFFTNQELVNFKNIWFYHDEIKNNHTISNHEYLKSFEKKYNIDIWKLAINERIFYRFNDFHEFTNNEILSIIEQECRLFEKILDDVKPDFFITKTPSLHHHQLFYLMCKAKGVKILMLHPGYLAYHCLLSNELLKPDVDYDPKSISDSGRNFSELQEFLTSSKLSKQMEVFDNSFAKSKNQQLKASFDYLFQSDNSNLNTHYSYFGRKKISVLFHEINSVIKKRNRKSFIDNNLSKNVNTNENFIYFPLHVDNERVLLIDAPLFTDQIEIIRQIVKSLPIGYQLFVKEHPSQSVRNWREISEYKEIMKIPNVTLFHPEVPSEEFYKKCSTVITITGTSGFEAAIYGKPSITFVDTGYAVLPSVFRLEKIEDLRKTIDLALESDVKPSDVDKYLNFLSQNYIKFDQFNFESKQANYFYYDGKLIDTTISSDAMRSFLKENESSLDALANEHFKKINYHKRLLGSQK